MCRHHHHLACTCTGVGSRWVRLMWQAAKLVMLRDKSQFCINRLLRQHFISALGSGRNVVVPKAIARSLRSLSRAFRVGRQEDAQEFCRELMTAMQASHLKVRGSGVGSHPLRHSLRCTRGAACGCACMCVCFTPASCMASTRASLAALPKPPSLARSSAGTFAAKSCAPSAATKATPTTRSWTCRCLCLAAKAA